MSTQREFWSDIGPESDDTETSTTFLPTPTARDANNARNRTSSRQKDSKYHDGVTLCDLVTILPHGDATSSPQDSPVHQYRLPDPDSVNSTHAGSGRKFAELSDCSDPNSSWLKTSQGCYQRMMQWDEEEVSLEEFSETWPRSGTMRNGTASQLPTLAPRISGTGFSSLPTPAAQDATRGAESTETKQKRGSGGINLVTAARLLPTPAAGRHGMDGGSNSRKKFIKDMGAQTLSEAIEMFPSPSARDYRSGKGRTENGHTPQLCETIGGLLSPNFVEWLMGFPRNFTET